MYHTLIKKEEHMGDPKEHLGRFLELSKKIKALGESIGGAEKDLKFQWVDAIEQRDLQDIKDHMKAVQDTLRILQTELDHIEAAHSKR
jgi:hypothetical protein